MIDKMKAELEGDNDSSVVNVLDWTSRLALDVLGVCKYCDMYLII